MNLSTKIYFALFFLALAIVFYFSYPTIKQRYLTNDETISSSQNEKHPQSDKDGENNENENLPESENPEENFIPEEETTIFIKIEKEDCMNECADFPDGKEKDYCLKVCDSDSFAENSEDCSQKSGLEKDYCYKVSGIQNKDFDECRKITDRNLRESCITTVADRLLERSDDERNP